MKHLHLDAETDGFCGAYWAFTAAGKYLKECRQKRIDIEERMCRVISEYKGEK